MRRKRVAPGLSLAALVGNLECTLGAFYGSGNSNLACAQRLFNCLREPFLYRQTHHIVLPIVLSSLLSLNTLSIVCMIIVSLLLPLPTAPISGAYVPRQMRLDLEEWHPFVPTISLYILFL
jgi:hypothetical protein